MARPGIYEYWISEIETGNPNILNALKELEISRISYNTYQSVSGSGKKGIDDLLRCRKGEVPLFYETDISFTCIPKIGEINENGISDEEDKLMFEGVCSHSSPASPPRQWAPVKGA